MRISDKIYYKIMKNSKLYSIIFLLVIYIIYDKILNDLKTKILIRKLQSSWSCIKTQFETFDYSDGCSVINKVDSQYRVDIDNFTYPHYIPLILNKSLNYECLDRRVKNDTPILFFLATAYFEFDDYKFDLGKIKQFENVKCPVTNCEITNDFKRYNQSDVAVFHAHNLYQINQTFFEELLKLRPKNQRWALVEYETPITHFVGKSFYKRFEGLFNYSWSYNSNISDLKSIYQINSNFIWEKVLDNSTSGIDYHKDKLNFSAALISHCDAASGRIEYLNKLRKYITVDIFGYNPECSNSTCPNNEDCRAIISRNYKFYFAFENSFCNGYITEKFYKILNYNIVPVVSGLGDYSKYAPKSAYINALDFKSIKDLAMYLIHLDKNPQEYNKYFEWRSNVKRSHYTYSNTYPKSGQIVTYYDFCEMCIRLHLEKFTGVDESRVKSLDEFLDPAKICKKPRFMDDLFFLDPYA